jgi:nucleotide-binding universal stress UspA family protein
VVERETRRQAEDLGLPAESIAIERGSSPLLAILARSAEADLLVLGSGRGGRHRLIGDFTRRVAGEASCPLVAIAQAVRHRTPRV